MATNADGASIYASLTAKQKIEVIAASAPFALPQRMIDAALANGDTPEQFAIAAADFATAVRARLAPNENAAGADSDVDAVVARILSA